MIQPPRPPPPGALTTRTIPPPAAQPRITTATGAATATGAEAAKTAHATETVARSPIRDRHRGGQGRTAAATDQGRAPKAITTGQ